MPETHPHLEASLLHNLDPRLKVSLCLGLVVLTFASLSWLPLILAAIGCWLLVVAAGTPMEKLWKTWWSLRWLLLFTFLMHLLLSPGRMLLGTRWLSLDGLLQGAFICTQLSIAVLCAMLLSLTTSAEKLSAALVWFLTPLKKLGCPVNDWHQQLLLVFKFLPIVREEYLVMNGVPSNVPKSSISDYLENWVERLKLLLDRLIERAEGLVQNVIKGGQEWERAVTWPALDLLSAPNARVSVFATVFSLCYLMANSL